LVLLKITLHITTAWRTLPGIRTGLPGIHQDFLT
jgi:hypothetical protein